MTLKEELREKVINLLEARKMTPSQINNQTKPNIFPIGVRALYSFVLYGTISEGGMWKLYGFFKEREYVCKFYSNGFVYNT